VLALYRSLLRLYPADYFREYAAEMTRVFTQASEEAHKKRLAGRLLFFTREISGVIGGALRQRFFGGWGWNSSRRFDMEFRFPRSTIFLMWVILAGVLLAIEKAKVIAMPYGPTHMRSAWSMLPWFIVLTVVVVSGAGATVWGILFALRRTGMHRLENLDTAPNN
jgi:hypothetical protein